MSKKTLFNNNWEFAKVALGTTLEDLLVSDVAFQAIDLPHDWLISQAENLYEDSMGWYRKFFHLPLEYQEDSVITILFEGIYMDSIIYLNRHKVGEWKNGYATFEIDITEFLQNEINELLISVNYQSPNTRWYSGAGIYRDVWLKLSPYTRIVSDGIYIHTQKEDTSWTVTIDTELINTEKVVLRQSIFDKATHTLITSIDSLITPSDSPKEKSLHIHQRMSLNNVLVWDIESPNLYILKTELMKGSMTIDSEYTSFGFRTIHFDPQQGFLLNNKVVKIKGVCEHHDLGCLGAAYHQEAMKRKFEILKKMGANAIRTAHNMPAPGVLELADELGFLINLESYDTWALSKTTYDYARFFKEWYPKDIASWVRRDRNHPSVIMWSIGNEIYDIHASEEGIHLTQMLMDEVKKHDPLGNAMITMGSNYLPWINAQKSADVLKLVGYNYAEKYYNEHHTKYPDWIIYGSETASTVQSRGVYHFPFYKSVLTDVDLQCSALGNSTTSWGAASTEACIIADRDHSFSCGQFIWSGFDYIGEPTPYHTKNSYFGQIDTAGFPKDSYYIYQAEWTDYKVKPMVHLFPYWDFNKDQQIDVRICSNAPLVELRKNGMSVGFFEIDHQQGHDLVAHFKIPYEEGTLEAIAYDEYRNIIAIDTKYSFKDARKINLSLNKSTINCGGRDLAFLEISMLDKNNHPVENANNRVRVNVTGAGRLLGLDNGDSTDYESYKGLSRRLFNGKLLAVIGSCIEPGMITIEVTCEGMDSQIITLESKAYKLIKGCSTIEQNCESSPLYPKTGIDLPIRKIELTHNGTTHLNESCRDVKISARILPENALYSELIWSVVDDSGIISNIATLVCDKHQAIVTAKGDGHFHVRCMCKNNTEHISVISQLDFEVTGLGKAYLNPYDFISGGLYEYSTGNATNGNEQGVATARDGKTQVGFRDIDFGNYGSDEITIPIFALTSEPYELEIWEGMPLEEGSSLLGHFVYQKPSIWNVYQPVTYKLNKYLKGITSLCFVTQKKLHIKGFSFTPLSHIGKVIPANTFDQIYGDTFKVTEEFIKDIGNNVTLEFNQLNFGVDGITHITICGETTIEKNTIRLLLHNEHSSSTQILEIPKQEGTSKWSFKLDKVYGIQNISFIFLPGSNFDFKWFSFSN